MVNHKPLTIADFIAGDLIVDMREHRPRIGRVLHTSDYIHNCAKPFLAIAFEDFPGRDQDYDANLDFYFREVPIQFVRKCEAPSMNFGQRIDLDVEPSCNISRLEKGMAIYTFNAWRKNTFWSVGKNFDLREAIEHLTKTYISPETSAAAFHADQTQPFRSFHDWQVEELDELIQEDGRRHSANTAWDNDRTALVSFLSALGAVVEIEDGANSGQWRDLSVCIAIAEEHEDDLRRMLISFGVDELYQFARHLSPDDEVQSCSSDAERIVERHGSSPIRPGETAAEILVRIAKPQEAFEQIKQAWEKSRGNTDLFNLYVSRVTDHSIGIQFAVDGLIPRGMVTLVAGEKGRGKSTWITQMAICVAHGIPFCGLPVAKDVQGKTAVIVSGEDTDAVLKIRIEQMQNGLSVSPAVFSLLPCGQGLFQSIDQALEVISPIEDLSLVVIDTVSAFCSRTNDAAPARDFMNLLASFAQKKDCAVVVMHHVNKSARTNSLKGIMDGIKGSGEFANAARVVLGFYRDKNLSVVEIGKQGLTSSVPILTGKLRMAYDPNTELCAPVEDPVLMTVAEAANSSKGAQVPTSKTAADPLADARILAVVVNRAIAQGLTIARSGIHEPYNLKAAEIADWPRARVRSAHASAIQAGLITPESHI